MQARRQPPAYRAIPLLFSTSDWPQNNTLGDNNDLGLAALSPPQPPTQALTFLIASVKDGGGGPGRHPTPDPLLSQPCRVLRAVRGLSGLTTDCRAAAAAAYKQQKASAGHCDYEGGGCGMSYFHMALDGARRPSQPQHSLCHWCWRNKETWCGQRWICGLGPVSLSSLSRGINELSDATFKT